MRKETRDVVLLERDRVPTADEINTAAQILEGGPPSCLSFKPYLNGAKRMFIIKFQFQQLGLSLLDPKRDA